MRYWVILLAVAAALPSSADTRFRVARMTRTDVPVGQGQCDIRVSVDNDVEITVRRDMVFIRTLAGQDARNDGSECNFPLPDNDVRGFRFQGIDGRNLVELLQPPTRRNDFGALIHIRDTSGGFGGYHFRLTWDATAVGDPRRDTGMRREEGDRGNPPPDFGGRRGPEGFAWNNVLNFRGRGQGESRLNEYRQRLADVTVDVDRSANIVVSFRAEGGRTTVFSGIVVGRDGARLRADMTTQDHRLRGIMVLSVDDRQSVNSITMEATDGRDRLNLSWDRR